MDPQPNPKNWRTQADADTTSRPAPGTPFSEQVLALKVEEWNWHYRLIGAEYKLKDMPAAEYEQLVGKELYSMCGEDTDLALAVLDHRDNRGGWMTGDVRAWLTKTKTNMPISLTIPDNAWDETGWDDPTIDGRDRLLAQVTINGTPHHMEAYRAIESSDGYVRLANESMEAERMSVLQAVYSGGYSLTTIRGEKYVVFMFPHAT